MRLALSSTGKSGLDVFVRRNRWELLSVLFTAFSMHVFLQVHYVAPKRHLTEDLARNNAFLERENKKLSVHPHVASAKPQPDIAGAAATPASSLTRLISLAAAHEVRVGGLALEGTGNRFTTQVQGDFRGFVRFLARLERLHVSIWHMELKPAGARSAEMNALLSIEIGPEAMDVFGASTLEVPDLPTLVNPFDQRSCTTQAQLGEGSKKDDVKGPKLSAITQFGDQAFATLNGNDYAIGDSIGAFRVAEISPNSVRLSGGAGAPVSCLVLSLPPLLSKADPDRPAAPDETSATAAPISSRLGH